MPSFQAWLHSTCLECDQWKFPEMVVPLLLLLLRLVNDIFGNAVAPCLTVLPVCLTALVVCTRTLLKIPVLLEKMALTLFFIFCLGLCVWFPFLGCSSFIVGQDVSSIFGNSIGMRHIFENKLASILLLRWSWYIGMISMKGTVGRIREIREWRNELKLASRLLDKTTVASLTRRQYWALSLRLMLTSSSFGLMGHHGAAYKSDLEVTMNNDCINRKVINVRTCEQPYQRLFGLSIGKSIIKNGPTNALKIY